MRSFFLPVFLCLGLSGFAADPKTPKKSVPAQPTQAPKKTALDKSTLEAYVRHLFVWGPQIKIEISDPQPAPMPGFQAVKVNASAGNASQEETFYVSADGQKIVRGQVFDVAQNPFKPELDKLKTQFQPSFGTPGAPVVLVVFSDFQCSFCKEEAKTLRSNVLAAYPKQVRVYFKDFPLEAIHPWAKAASIGGRCVFRLNAPAFWDYHDWLFETQAQITTENLKEKTLEWAKGKEIDVLQLGRCIDTRQTEAEVEANIADARALGVNSTPTLFINGRRITGRTDWNMLRQIIDYEIDYQRTARNAGEDCGCEVSLPSAFPR
jgi:protein-disulfide isomerase